MHVLRLLLLAPSLVFAQSPATTQRVGSITGVVFDSLFARAPLADASILVDGLDRTATTNAKGEFTVDSVPAGAYRITFFHPSLDRAGVQVAPAAVAVAVGSSTEIMLATPSLGTVALRRCGSASVNRLLFGTVVRSGEDTPVGGATVRASWVEIGENATPMRRSVDARSSNGGGFILCDPPGNSESRLLADAGDGSVGVTTLLPGAPGASIITVRIPPEGGDGRARNIVLDANGAPLGDATIDLGTKRSVRTDSSGRFAMSWSELPNADIVVRAVGRQAVALSGDELPTIPTGIAITLRRSTATLADVNVRVAKRPLWLEEFEARKTVGLGTFITRADIDKRNPSQLHQMLFGVPGMQVNRDDGRARTLYPGTFRSCEPRYFVDGVLFTDPPIEQPGVSGTPQTRPPGPLILIPPTEVEAMEVYSRASGVPKEFAGTGSACGTIVIWTRRGGER